MKNQKAILIIMDGWGLSDKIKGNAIKQAKTPVFDKLWLTYPHAVLQASGEAVGLPEGQIGTSEVNHMTIGAGRVIFQDLVKINKSILDKTFFNNKAIVQAFEHVKKYNSTLHLKGLVSPGGVHSHQEHLYALLKGAKMYGISKVYIHVFTDGRDTLPKSARQYLSELETFIKELGLGKIASISGRYYAMDRDHNFTRTDKTFNILIGKSKPKKFLKALDVLEDSYSKDITDEFIEPALVEVGSGEDGCISVNDAVIFLNFRSDRTRQLTERFLTQGPNNLNYVTMTNYHSDYEVKVAFPKEEIENTLGEIISRAGLKQLRITETEKFNHLTYFLNGKTEKVFEGEDRIMLDSYSDIKTHDEKPEMRTKDIVREILQAIESNSHQVIMTNLCNCDMVGHTAKMQQTIRGVEIVDWALKEITQVGLKNSYNIFITADHGNAEELIDEATGEPKTAHTGNPVPFIMVSSKKISFNTDQASLHYVAPTILKSLGLKIPKEMTGRSLY